MKASSILFLLTTSIVWRCSNWGELLHIVLYFHLGVRCPLAYKQNLCLYPSQQQQEFTSSLPTLGCLTWQQNRGKNHTKCPTDLYLILWPQTRFVKQLTVWPYLCSDYIKYLLYSLDKTNSEPSVWMTSGVWHSIYQMSHHWRKLLGFEPSDATMKS